jgi:hypothetical protein
MSNSKLTNEIMMRVRFISLAKRVVRPFAIEIVVVVAALLELGRMVFVAKVLENAPGLSRLDESFSFFTRAFTHTESYVQLSVLALAVAGFFVVKDAVKTIRAFRELRFRTV